jgi:hypothetical protein
VLSSRKWVVGESHVYAYHNARTLSVGADLEHAKEHPLGLDAELVLTPVSADAKEVQVRVELRGARMTSVDPPPVDAAKGELAKPFYATFEPSGRAVRFHFDPAVGSEARDHLKAVIATLQLVAPGGDLQGDWESTEEDGTGEYVARYSARGSMPTVRKVKLRYDRVHTAKGLVPPVDVGEYRVTSDGTTTLSDDGWPRSMDDDERVAIELKGQKLGIAMTSVTTATLARVERAPELVGAFEREGKTMEARTFDVQDQIAAGRAGIDVARIKGDDFGAMTATLRGLSASSREDQTHANRMLVRLGALMRVHPEDADEAQAAIVEDPESLTAQVLEGALGSAGTPQAQHALGAVATNGALPAPTRVRALAALGQVAQPTAETVAATRAAMAAPEHDVQSTATLALGNEGRSPPQGAEDPVTVLLGRLAAATTPAEEIVDLQALGNSWDERALPAIEKMVLGQATSAPVRAAAVGALVFMQAPEVDPLINAELTRDFSPEVRVKALMDIDRRGAGSFSGSILGTLKADPSSNVRGRTLAVVLKDGAAIPGALEAVTWTATKDPDPGLRATAAAALRGGGWKVR